MNTVYIIAPCCGTPCKIGVTTNIIERISRLQTGNPLVLKLYWSKNFEVKYDAYSIEKEVHKRLSDKRLSGEWFNIEPIEAISMVGIVESYLESLAIDETEESPPLKNDSIIKHKKQMIEIFGSIERCAIALDMTRQTLNNWPETLAQQQRNHMLGAAINEGYLKCKVTNK